MNVKKDISLSLKKWPNKLERFYRLSFYNFFIPDVQLSLRSSHGESGERVQVHFSVAKRSQIKMVLQKIPIDKIPIDKIPIDKIPIDKYPENSSPSME